jgi:predicted ester cyclase
MVKEFNGMSAIDSVKAGLEAIEAHDFKRVEELLADDMKFVGPVPEPVGKREFIGLQSALISAMPDWRFNPSDFKEDGDIVTVMLQISGTQTGELNLPLPGIPKIPPTGKHVSLPEELTTFTVKNGKVTMIDTESSPVGGVQGILMQLGVPMPH